MFHDYLETMMQMQAYETLNLQFGRFDSGIYQKLYFKYWQLCSIFCICYTCG